MTNPKILKLKYTEFGYKVNLPGDIDGDYVSLEDYRRLQSALATLRAAARAVIEQTDRDAAIGLGGQFSRLDIYEVGLTGEQVEALRVALVESEGA